MKRKIFVHGHNRKAVELTDLLAALLSSAVHDDRWVDEGAGSGHILSQQAFHFVRTQTDGQIKELHRSSQIPSQKKGTTMTWVNIRNACEVSCCNSHIMLAGEGLEILKRHIYGGWSNCSWWIFRFSLYSAGDLKYNPLLKVTRSSKQKQTSTNTKMWP